MSKKKNELTKSYISDMLTMGLDTGIDFDKIMPSILSIMTYAYKVMYKAQMKKSNIIQETYELVDIIENEEESDANDKY